MTSHSAGTGRRGAAPDDAQLLSLLEQVSAGTVKVYRATIPIRYIRPYSPTYKPGSLGPVPTGEDAPPLLTYQVGEFFMMSVDYPMYYGQLEANNDAVPCLVLGEPIGPHVTGVQPLDEQEVIRYLGIRPGTAVTAHEPAIDPEKPRQVNIF